MASLDESTRHNVLISRRTAIDPGDVNTMAAVELGRALKSEGNPESGEHRPQIKTHLSKKNYERRTFRHKHARWEVRRRRDILRNMSSMLEGTEIPVPFRRSTPASDVT